MHIIGIAAGLIAATALGAVLADAGLRHSAGRRRHLLEALQAEAINLLSQGRDVATGDPIDAALARIAGLIGAERIWVMPDASADGFHGWDAAGELRGEAAVAEAARITGRFPWDGNAILVRPGSRAAMTWAGWLRRRSALPLSTLLLRSRDMDDTALLCAASTTRMLMWPEMVQALAGALLAILQLERRRRMEADRVALESKLALGRRMETVGALASGVAHNLNNILNAIGGFRETAALHVPRESVAGEAMAEIGHAIGRAARLVEDVLRFGRRVEGVPEPVDIGELLRETQKLLSASLSDTVTLKVDEGEEPLLVAGDFAQLQQVLLNLCSNAAQAMPDGGLIACVATPRLLEDPVRLSHGVLRRGRYAKIIVADEGHGIAEHAIPHLFAAFYTTRPEGTGLGLSTAREMIERHGGAIDVDSVLGVGTSFTIWLPRVPDEAADAPARSSRRGAGEIVMLVGTDARRVSGDEELIAALGYEPLGLVAENGRASPLPATAVDAVVVTALDPAAAHLIAADIRDAGVTAPLLIAVPQPDGGEGALRYPFQPAALAYALSRGLQASSDMTTVAL